jgi:hypothetical protein
MGVLQGLNNSNGGLVVIDVASQVSTPLVNNWVGLPFNSPNDVAVHKESGAILFTDPPYGYAQGFRPTPLVGQPMGCLQRSAAAPVTAHSICMRRPWTMLAASLHLCPLQQPPPSCLLGPLSGGQLGVALRPRHQRHHPGC